MRLRRCGPRDAIASARCRAERILNYYRLRLTSGVIEGLNSFVQAARARARGYRNPDTVKIMIYLIAGDLDCRLPVITHVR